MPVSRRAVLLAPLLAAAAPAARLRPGASPAVLALRPLPQERVAFRAAGIAGAIVLPAPRARLLAVLPLGAYEVAALAFAADPPDATAPGGRLDLLALVGCDAAGLRIAALDVLSWRDAASHLTTRLTAEAGATGLVLQRDAAVRRSATLWRRETWTDYLAADGGMLRDAPVRPPLPGTWQHAMSAWRAEVAAELAPGRRQVAGRLAALCVPPIMAIGEQRR